MMESLEIQDIDGMIHTLEKELASVNIERSSSLSDGATVAIVPTIEKKVLPSEQRVEEEISDQKEESKPPAKPIDSGAKQFALLIDKLYDRNYELGECFKKVIVYISFEKDILTWESTANDEEKRLLRNHWSLIRMFVQEIFGYETSIKNISKELPPQKRVEPTPLESIEEPISMIEEEVLGHTVEHTNLKSHEEESEKKEEIQEKDKSTILDEPMVAKALELFAPKRVRVKRKS
jgi:DNA polymerase-3 subunit gamma/tau